MNWNNLFNLLLGCCRNVGTFLRTVAVFLHDLLIMAGAFIRRNWKSIAIGCAALILVALMVFVWLWSYADDFLLFLRFVIALVVACVVIWFRKKIARWFMELDSKWQSLIVLFAILAVVPIPYIFMVP